MKCRSVARGGAVLVGVVAVTGLLGACGSGGTTPAAVSAAPTTAVATADVPDAHELTRALQAAGLPLDDVIVYTEATDPNHKLGRPGGYLSKTAFVDPRVDASRAGDADPGAVELGGSLEVFAEHKHAVRRAKYVQGAVQSVQILGGEYDYLAEGVLLRLSPLLGAGQAQQYADALEAHLGVTFELLG